MKYYSSVNFCQSFENTKAILSSQVIRKQVAGQIWLAGCSLLNLVEGATK